MQRCYLGESVATGHNTKTKDRDQAITVLSFIPDSQRHVSEARHTTTVIAYNRAYGSYRRRAALFSLHGEQAGKEHVGGEMRLVLINHVPPIKKAAAPPNGHDCFFG